MAIDRTHKIMNVCLWIVAMLLLIFALSGIFGCKTFIDVKGDYYQIDNKKQGVNDNKLEVPKKTTVPGDIKPVERLKITLKHLEIIKKIAKDAAFGGATWLYLLKNKKVIDEIDILQGKFVK
jgi:hypothetical protein